MTVTGHIENGRVVLDQALALPEGAKVRVELIPAESESCATDSQERSPRTLAEILKPVIGAIKDGPPDFARNHDHYIHGVPKE